MCFGGDRLPTHASTHTYRGYPRQSRRIYVTFVPTSGSSPRGRSGCPSQSRGCGRRRCLRRAQWRQAMRRERIAVDRRGREGCMGRQDGAWELSHLAPIIKHTCARRDIHDGDVVERRKGAVDRLETPGKRAREGGGKTVTTGRAGEGKSREPGCVPGELWPAVSLGPTSSAPSTALPALPPLTPGATGALSAAASGLPRTPASPPRRARSCDGSGE